MKKYSLLFFILFPLFAWANDCKTNVDKNNISFLLLGQSNMAGQGKVRELDKLWLKQADNLCFYLNGSLAHFKQQEKFGPEIAFAHDMALAYPNKRINLVKFAPGGSLMKDWLASGKHYLTLKKQLSKIRKSTPLHFKGVLWMQGERDTKSKKLALSYENELIHFIQLIRTDVKQQKLDFVIGKISIPEAYRPAVKEVKQAQEAVTSKLRFVKIIPTDTLKKNKDNVHYSTEGQLALGHLFAKKLLSPK